jgi:hypothetical protein
LVVYAARAIDVKIAGLEKRERAGRARGGGAPGASKNERDYSFFGAPTKRGTGLAAAAAPPEIKTPPLPNSISKPNKATNTCALNNAHTYTANNNLVA